MTQLMDLKVDYAFKRLFGSKGNEKILMSFLNAVLALQEGERITSLKIENPELNPEYLGDKKSVLDIYAITEEGDDIMREALEKWESLSRDRQAQLEYESRFKAVMDDLSFAAETEKRLQHARDEGKREQAFVVARNLLESGFRDTKQIAKLSGLPFDEVQKLLNEMESKWGSYKN